MEKNNSSKRIELTQRQMFKCTSCSLEIDQFCLELNLAKERIKKKHKHTHLKSVIYILWFLIIYQTCFNKKMMEKMFNFVCYCLEFSATRWRRMENVTRNYLQNQKLRGDRDPCDAGAREIQSNYKYTHTFLAF